MLPRVDEKSPQPKIPSLLGLTIICAGGCMDALSFLLHGEVFATGQTGNIVLLFMHLLERDVPGALHYLFPIISFFIGILLSKFTQDFLFHQDTFRMQHWVTVFEAAVFSLIAFLPSSTPDHLVNCTISLCAAVAFENFRKFGTRSSYASMFCTGNLRSFAETLYDGIVKGDTHELHRAQRYAGLILSFGIGVSLGTIFAKCIGSLTALLISGLFLYANTFIFRAEHSSSYARHGNAG